MVCLRTFRRHWICSTFVFSLFLLFSVFGFSQNSYATTNTCDLTTFDNYNINSGDFGSRAYNFCPRIFDGLDTSSYIYLSYDAKVTVFGSSPVVRMFRLYYDSSTNFPALAFATSGLSAGSYTFSGSVSIVGSSLPHYVRSSFWSGGIDGASFSSGSTLTASDEPPSSGEPEPCPVCPEIPENPYDNKFDALTKSIYCCGAILIMLYFFFCIYKIIVKDGGSR